MASLSDLMEYHMQTSRDELARIMSAFGYTGQKTPFVAENAWHPPTDVYETPTHVMVKMDVAGVKPSEIMVSLNDNVLTIRGRRDESFRAHAVQYRQMEIQTGIFERVIALNVPIEEQGIEAHYRNGFLEIAIPKGQKRAPTSILIRISL